MRINLKQVFFLKLILLLLGQPRLAVSATSALHPAPSTSKLDPKLGASHEELEAWEGSTLLKV